MPTIPPLSPTRVGLRHVRSTMDATYRPDRKIVAGAVAAILVWLLQAAAGVDVPAGIEGAFAVVVAYLVPSTTVRPLDDD